jgi:RNA polymerase sigma-70 factor (ECF subfamily)
MNLTATIQSQIDDLYRTDSRRIYASLVRLLGDFDLADDAMHEAFAAAIESWPREGMPANPRAWLVSAGKFKAINMLRREGRAQELQPEIAARLDAVAHDNATRAGTEIEDDRLRLIFTCCHPAIDPNLQVPLTLREVCGLTTEEIAHAFLTSKATMAQRIVRGKARIREEQIPYAVPGLADLPERLDAVLSAIYLVFTEGYAASRGASLTRVDLTAEAIRLGRLLVELLPDPEAQGLLALMLLHESRRDTRSSTDGELILLEEQDRSRWDHALIAEGTALVAQSLRSRRFGVYTLQAAISAVHARANAVNETDWNQIISLYNTLLNLDSSPIVELNRAVAVAMRDGPEAGIHLIDAVLERGDLVNYHRIHAARAELCRRAGKRVDAKVSYERAITLTQQEPERRFLMRRLAEI